MQYFLIGMSIFSVISSTIALVLVCNHICYLRACCERLEELTKKAKEDLLGWDANGSPTNEYCPKAF